MADVKEVGKRISKAVADETAQTGTDAPETPAKPAETPETPETPTPEPAPETPEPKPTATRSPEQTQKAFDRAVTAFHGKLCDVFEVEELTPAGTPGIIGFLLPGFMDKRTHDDFTRCSTCNGHGNVLTGSLKTGDDERPCPDPRCKGRGYWERARAPEPAPNLTMVPLPGPTNGGGEWGEAPAWMGDPRLSTPIA